MHRVRIQVSISLRRLWLREPEQGSDHMQAQMCTGAVARECMAKVMDAETRKPSGFGDGRPWFLQIGARFALVVFVPCRAGKYMRVPMYAGQLVQDREAAELR